MNEPGNGRILWVGLLVGLLLNLTGWLGNNFLFGALWEEVGAAGATLPWRNSIWKDVFSFVPDFVYGIAIAWLFVSIRPRFRSFVTASIATGLFVSVVGGITTYFAIANSGFVPWKLALLSFVLVIGTKFPLALLAGRMLDSA